MPTEVIAESILEISKGMKQLHAGKLNEKALTVLLCHSTGFGAGTVRTVLQALDELEAQYIKKKEKN